MSAEGDQTRDRDSAIPSERDLPVAGAMRGGARDNAPADDPVAPIILPARSAAPAGSPETPATAAPAQRPARIFYRKQKLQGACWEYEIAGGWLKVPFGGDVRDILHHHFTFFRPREATRRTPAGVETVLRVGAEQWFFPDRWFSLLRFTTTDGSSIGYYVNFSRPLEQVRENYYSDVDLELDLWLDLDGTLTELDRDEYEAEIETARLTDEWRRSVDRAAQDVQRAVAQSVAEHGPDVEGMRDPIFGIPEFILRA